MPHNSNGKGIVLIGDGGHARAVRDVIESLNGYSISLGGRVSVAWIVDDSREANWEAVALKYPRNRYIIGVGQIKTAQPRVDIYTKMQEYGLVSGTLISPHAYVSPSAEIWPGTVIMHGAVVNTGAHVGKHCIINTNAVVEHDAYVSDFCHISTGAIVNGGAVVGKYSFVGSNAVVLNQIKLCPKVVLGAGSVACIDIEQAGIYRVSPAGRVK